MHEDRDLTWRVCRVPEMLADRMAKLARGWGTTSSYVYRASMRVVALHPPEYPVAYPSVRSKDVVCQIVVPRNLKATTEVLVDRFFYARLPWLYLYGSTKLEELERLVRLDLRDQMTMDEERYRYWLHGGQPACIPTTARAPGVRSKRRPF